MYTPPVTARGPDPQPEASIRTFADGRSVVTIADSDLPWTCVLTIAEIDEVNQVVGLELRPKEYSDRHAVITSAALRQLPLRNLKRRALAVLYFDLATYARARKARSRGPRDLERVAASWEEARRAGRPPTQAVMEEWGLSRAAASNWVRRAREEGLLARPPKPSSTRAKRGSK